MIVAIDGYEANVADRVGIGRYAYEILCSMYARLSKTAASAVSVRVYLPTLPGPDMPKETSWWTYHVVGPRRLWTFIGLPAAIMRDAPRADVVFSPTHYAPRFTSVPRVMAIMDVSYIHFPSMFRARDLHKLTYWTKYSVSKAKRIVTISEFSKNAIIKAYHVPPERVVVTYPGLSMADTHGSGTSADITAKYKIPKHFILSVGTIQPRKNYARLIEAFSLFLRSNRQKFGEVGLVIVGKKGWLVESILEAPKRFGVEGGVHFLDFVADRDLPALYSQALCFALPSLYEGFGLPVLEAMAYRCPVVVSNVSSLPEIAGKAGVYVDPKDPASIANGLLTAVRQRNLIQGKTRIQRGLSQAKLFTWEGAAEKTLEVLKEVARGR